MKLLKILKNRRFSITAGRLMALLVMMSIASCESCRQTDAEAQLTIKAPKDTVIDENIELTVENTGKGAANREAYKLKLTLAEQGGTGSKLECVASSKQIGHGEEVSLKDLSGDEEETLDPEAQQLLSFKVIPGSGVTSFEASFELLDTEGNKIGDAKVTWKKTAVPTAKLEDLTTAVTSRADQEVGVKFKIKNTGVIDLDHNQLSLKIERTQGDSATLQGIQDNSLNAAGLGLNAPIAATNASSELNLKLKPNSTTADSVVFKLTLFYKGEQLDEQSVTWTLAKPTAELKDLTTAVTSRADQEAEVKFKIKNTGVIDLDHSQLSLKIERTQGDSATLQGIETGSLDATALARLGLNAPIAATNASPELTLELKPNSTSADSVVFELTLFYGTEELNKQTVTWKKAVPQGKLKDLTTTVSSEKDRETEVKFKIENTGVIDLDHSQLSLKIERTQGDSATLQGIETGSLDATALARLGLNAPIAATSASPELTLELNPNSTSVDSVVFKLTLFYKGEKLDEQSVTWTLAKPTAELKDLTTAVTSRADQEAEVKFKIENTGVINLDHSQLSLKIERTQGDPATLQGIETGSLDATALARLGLNAPIAATSASPELTLELKPNSTTADSVVFELTLFYGTEELNKQTVTWTPTS